MSPDPFVLASRVITQQVRHLTGLLKQANGLADNPPEGTPARADFDHINDHKQKKDLLGLRWWAHKGAILNLSSGAEHVRGLMAIVVSDQLMPLPAMTLGRAIYEAAFNTFWLIQPDVSTEQRIARWAGRLLHDSQEPPNALDSFGEVDAAEGEKERVLEGRGLGQKLMRQAGIQLTLKGGDRSEETRLVTWSSPLRWCTTSDPSAGSGADGLEVGVGHLLGLGGDGLGSGDDVEAEVAASFGPFVVLLGQDGADESDDGLAVGGRSRRRRCGVGSRG